MRLQTKRFFQCLTTFNPRNVNSQTIRYEELRDMQNLHWANQAYLLFYKLLLLFFHFQFLFLFFNRVLKGIEFAKKRDFQTAEKYYQQALSVCPRCSMARVAKGAAFVIFKLTMLFHYFFFFSFSFSFFPIQHNTTQTCQPRNACQSS